MNFYDTLGTNAIFKIQKKMYQSICFTYLLISCHFMAKYPTKKYPEWLEIIRAGALARSPE